MDSSPADRDPQHLRASDADREGVANVLREAAGDGRLTMAELDERLDAVYAAKTYAELEPITHDLPATGAAYTPAVPPCPGPGSAASPPRRPRWPSSAASPVRATGWCPRPSTPSCSWAAARSTCA